MTVWVGVIGNGKMALDCLKVLLNTDEIGIKWVISDPTVDYIPELLENFCIDNNIELIKTKKINTKSIVDYVVNSLLDYIFNINSFLYIGDDLLNSAKNGIINFHNGPLPRYRGVNPCSWAIINGETEHGVAWHFINQKIDAGDVIAKTHFSLSPQDSALSLIIKCINEGIILFKTVVEDIISDRVYREPQDEGAMSYFGRKDFPFNGDFPFSESGETLDRLSRALNFHPIENTFFIPRFNVNGDIIWIKEFVLMNKHNTDEVPGTILELDSKSITVATLENRVKLTYILGKDKRHIYVEDFMQIYNLSIGSTLGQQN